MAQQVRREEERMKDFVVLDLETTGLTPKTDRILEIGAIKVVDGAVKERYSTFINPQMEIPPRITGLTGITQDMVKNAPLREEAVRKLVEFCRDLPLLGHNILFDYSFVKHDAVNLGLEFEKEALDTLTVARLALPELESRSLEYLCGYFRHLPGKCPPGDGRRPGDAGAVPDSGAEICGGASGMVPHQTSGLQGEEGRTRDTGSDRLSEGSDRIS